MQHVYVTVTSKLTSMTEKTHERDVMERLELKLRPLVRELQYYFNGHTSLKADSNFIVFNIKELMNSDANIRNALFFNILKYAWSLCLDKSNNTVMYVDEAHILLGAGNELGAEFLAQVQRRSRKYNTGTIIITQQPTDFAAEKVFVHGKAIFDNASYYLVMGLRKQAVEDLAKLIDLNDNEKESIKTFDFYGARDKAIMSILATTGTRQSVIRELRYEWIEEIDGGIAFNVPKEYTKNKTLFRMVIGNKTLEYFNNYLKIVKDRNIESEYIFTSIKGNKLTLSDMDDMFKKTIKKARIDVKGKSCSCHCMRNALVTYLVKRGDVSETVLKEIFNWSKDTNSNMIERYSSKDVRAYDEIKLKILNII